MLRPGSKHEIGSVCKVGTQDPENLDEEVKPLVTVWCGERKGPKTHKENESLLGMNLRCYLELLIIAKKNTQKESKNHPFLGYKNIGLSIKSRPKLAGCRHTRIEN